MSTEAPVPEKPLSLKNAGGNALIDPAGEEARGYGPHMYGEFADEESIDLLGYWRTLVRRRWTVISFFAVTLAVTVTSLYLSPRIYRGTVLLKIEPESNKGTKIDDALGGDERAIYYDPGFYQTQYELLKSRTLAERVAESLNLKVNHEEGSGATKQAGTFVQNNVTVEPVRNSKLVKLHFNAADPELAARVANALADSYIKTSLERRYNATADAKNFLEQRIVQVKAKLEDAEHKLYAYAREQGIINIDAKDNQNLITAQLQDKTKELAEAERQRLTAESIYRESQNSGGYGSSKILADPLVQHLKEEKTKLELAYQEKVALFKPDYPEMVQLKEQIDRVNAQIEAEIGSVRSSLYADYQLALHKENMLRAAVAGLVEDVMRRQDAGSEYNILRREVETSRALYDGILQRLKEISVASGIGANNIAIIDPATPSAIPFKPVARNYLLAGILLGLFGGMGLAFLFEKLDDTVKLPEDMERLQLATLGIVPFLKVNPRAETAPLHLISYYDPRSGIAEAYRSLRTALTFSTSAGAPKVLHITSASEGEGKSTSAINLAVGFTQLGQSVLLIDADMRRPSLHDMLEVGDEKGLSHYLSGEARPSEVTHYVGVPNLFVIPAGPLPPNPGELLAGARMIDLVTLAAEKFDRVIIDGPPVLGLADAMILANVAQHTIMVAAAGKTRRSHLASSLKRLRGARSSILGGLMTMIDQRESGYRYYHNDYYNYEGSQPETPRLAPRQ